LWARAKSSLKKFERELLASDWKQVHEGLEVRLVPAPQGSEVFILCRSAEREVKEHAIRKRFEQRIEAGLQKIAESCRKRKQKPMIIATRVGRLLGRNTRAAALFEVHVESDAAGFARLHWSRSEARGEWPPLSEGCYVLRSNVTDWTPEELWRAYIQLTEAEAAFRIQKSGLQIRPMWHQRQDRVEAHILVCFLAYVLWKTLAAVCRQAGLGREPRVVFENLSELSLVDVVLATRSGTIIKKRCISQPTQHQLILLQRLGLRPPASLEITAV
jgi:transposase